MDRIKLIVYSMTGWVLFCFSLLYFAHENTSAQIPPGPGRQASAPTEIVARTIADMKENEEGHIPVDTLVVDMQGKCWLHKTQPLLGEKTGLKAKRDKEGYHLAISDKDLKWVRISLEKTHTLEPVRTITLGWK